MQKIYKKQINKYENDCYYQLAKDKNKKRPSVFSP